MFLKRSTARTDVGDLIPWLIAVVVVPSVLLSAFSFWAMQRQSKMDWLAARQRASAVLAQVAQEFGSDTEQLRADLSQQSPQDSPDPSMPAMPLLAGRFLLDARGRVLLPSPASMPQPATAPDDSRWKQAQELEFVVEDLVQAQILYQTLDSSSAQMGVARCAAKLGDQDVARRGYGALIASPVGIPTHLRLGASLALAELQVAMAEYPEAADTILWAAEWAARTSADTDYHATRYYLGRLADVWSTLPEVDSTTQWTARWGQANKNWRTRFAAYHLHTLLSETLLPLIWSQMATQPVGATDYFASHASGRWHVLLVNRATSEHYLGAQIALPHMVAQLEQAITDRLQKLGERALPAVLGTDSSLPNDALASLRLPPPWSFIQLGVLPTDDAEPFGLWQTRWMLWGTILCIGTLLLGLSWIGRRVRQTQELSRLKTDFVSNVSHELKTPLTSIRLYVETLRLKRYERPAQADEYLSILQNETERLARLVDRVLDFSRMERGRKEFHIAHHDLGSIVREAVSVFEQQSQGISVELEVGITDSLPTVSVDPDAVTEIVWNLLSNAVRYSQPPRQIAVRLAHTEDSIELSVTDNGIGIPRREQKRIFERFYRVDDRLAREAPGTGLGLSIVQYLVDAHGAAISVESRIGQGSSFRISFPTASQEIPRGTHPDH